MKFLFALVIFSFHFANAGGDIKAKTTTCVACHGEKGISANPLWPNLAGQKADYLAKQMRDFKAGRRQDPLMSPMANTISESDIDELAKYYNSLP